MNEWLLMFFCYIGLALLIGIAQNVQDIHDHMLGLQQHSIWYSNQ